MAPRDLVKWLQKERLLNIVLECPKCSSPVKLINRTNSIDGCSYRCVGAGPGKPKHETGVRYGSFLMAFRLPLADILNFIRDYLMGISMKMCAFHINCSYGTTAVRYALLMRECMMETVYQTYFADEDFVQLPGPVQIGNSLNNLSLSD